MEQRTKAVYVVMTESEEEAWVDSVWIDPDKAGERCRKRADEMLAELTKLENLSVEIVSNNPGDWDICDEYKGVIYSFSVRTSTLEDTKEEIS